MGERGLTADKRAYISSLEVISVGILTAGALLSEGLSVGRILPVARYLIRKLTPISKTAHTAQKTSLPLFMPS